MKYIVLEGGIGEAPVVFSRELTHRWVAERLRPMAAVSAGFVRMVDGEPQCYGKSDSLRLPSRPEADSVLVRKMLGADQRPD